jgi:hypothetical protein
LVLRSVPEEGDVRLVLGNIVRVGNISTVARFRMQY